MMKKFGLLAIIVGVVGVMVAVFILGNKAEAPTPELPRLGEKFPELSRTHIEPGTEHEAYNSNPPSSGPHYPAPAKWEIVELANVEADERYVHNLEHGGIWITYKPDLPSDQVNQLKQIFNSLPLSTNFQSIKAVMTPRAKNDHPISLVAWGYVQHLETPDAQKIKDFYMSHLDKGPELVP